MHSNPFETPVALFVFNRPKTTIRVFEAIASARPSRLLLIADGPRADRPGEIERCKEVREIVSRVDWPCEVSTNFSDINLGCQERVISGLNWVFTLVEETIILEDDCLPDATFFLFCSELLDRYRGDLRIASISGTCLTEKHIGSGNSYYFSQLAAIWGWATWRSRWERYDRDLRSWPDVRKQARLLDHLIDQKAVSYWTRIFDQMHAKKGPNTWDYQWLYSCFIHHSLIAIPRVNLVANIGFGDDATHALVVDSRLTPPSYSLEFPLQHPETFIPMRSLDRHFMRIALNSLSFRIKCKWQRMKAMKADLNKQ
jgi:hypothetical protein